MCRCECLFQSSPNREDSEDTFNFLLGHCMPILYATCCYRAFASCERSRKSVGRDIIAGSQSRR